MSLLQTERLLIRNWQESDRALFHRINSDDRVMSFFPFRRNRAEADEMMDGLSREISDLGYGLAALERKDDGQVIGFTGIRKVQDLPVLPDSSHEIGWRLIPEAWGKGFATEAANAWLVFAFRRLQLAEIHSFAVHDNLASLAVMQRIGMRELDGKAFDHPAVPDSHPHLKRHRLYRLKAEEWERL
ncbi:GNAT family N-acetyltransferase [Nitratireductor basaltis]|uniref:GCN5-related N-acetyltransferase n=1 Tax=Nitratireductor basaltis TaxID=472175 RepID=A0A084U9U8_9HYPH|nr:GNAT family N-acetyltransferase [Nitratireductor basaltis]KFB09734.1 GCN5-related N-acetyltransferase [Nitratireductor basaltis]